MCPEDFSTLLCKKTRQKLRIPSGVRSASFQRKAHTLSLKEPIPTGGF